MFNVNLLNKPGYQIDDQDNVISYRKSIDQKPVNRLSDSPDKADGKNFTHIFGLIAVAIIIVFISYFSIKSPIRKIEDTENTKYEPTIGSIDFFSGLYDIFRSCPEGTILHEFNYMGKTAGFVLFSSDMTKINQVNNVGHPLIDGMGKIHGNVAEGGYLTYQFQLNQIKNKTEGFRLLSSLKHSSLNLEFQPNIAENNTVFYLDQQALLQFLNVLANSEFPITECFTVKRQLEEEGIQYQIILSQRTSQGD